MIIPPDDETTRARTRLRASIMVAIGLVAAIGVAVIMFFGGASTPVLLPGLLAVGIVIAGGAILINMVAKQTAPEKDKRGLGDLDMYSLINRLVADLDDTELAYLDRKLDERRQRLDDGLTEDIGMLLEQRQEARQTGKRSQEAGCHRVGIR
ncbi:MAG: MnhB domain-containing protein, partial [Anaerolineae bacterium]|nr:MnhB domain-containing protein [Anaerolineae bacterium]